MIAQKVEFYSRTSDRDCRRFYSCEMIVSHIPVKARRIDKKRTAARRPHTSRTSIRAVIARLK